MTGPVTAPQHPFNPMDHPMRDQPPHPQSAMPPQPQPTMPLEGGTAREGPAPAQPQPQMQAQAQAMGPLAEGCHTHGGLSERQVRQIKRLPADIRAQVHALQVC